MKGLLVKDCQLLFQRKQTLILFFAVCCIVGFSADGSFIVGYMAFLSAIIAISTISYDDADNGMMFLMTLPVSRKTYALSKYVLGSIFCLGGWLLAIFMMLAINAVKGLPLDMIGNVVPSLAFLFMSLMILDLMIPLQLKFGAEKSRVVMFIVFGGIGALAAIIMRIAPQAVTSLFISLSRIPAGWLSTGALLLGCLLTMISAIASVRIMKKKAF